MNIFHAKFSTSQVINATGVTNDNLQNWLKRNLIVGQKDIEGGGSQGRHRQYSFFNLMEIAAAKALIDAGMTDLKSVFHAADWFSHSSDDDRLPGFPFNKGPGITLLVAGPGWARDVFVSPDQPALALYTQILHSGQTGAIVINMGKVFDRVVAAAGFHPEEVMEAAYKKEVNG